MFTTVVAIVCSLQGLCVEEIVTDSAMDGAVTFHGCMTTGQIGIAAWKEQHPVYRSSGYRSSGYRCVAGRYELKGRA